MKKIITGLIKSAAAAAIILAVGAVCPIQENAAHAQTASRDGSPEEIRIDYANYNPLSLVLRDRQILEEEFKTDNIKVKWVFSIGGNKAMEYLLSGSVDIAASAGAAALISFINGNPIKSIYVVNNSLNSIMVRDESDIKEISDLKGKSIAAAIGTDPYLFLIRTLREVNLTLKDIKFVPLQHPDGKNELARGRVDAWCAAEPQQSQGELEGLRYLYRKPEFGTGDLLSVREDFLLKHKDIVLRVLSAYEKARQWANNNHDDYVSIVARQINIKPDIARMVLEKQTIDSDEITDTLFNTLVETGRILRETGAVKKDTDPEKAVAGLVDRSYFRELKERK